MSTSSRKYFYSVGKRYKRLNITSIIRMGLWSGSLERRPLRNWSTTGRRKMTCWSLHENWNVSSIHTATETEHIITEWRDADENSVNNVSIKDINNDNWKIENGLLFWYIQSLLQIYEDAPIGKWKKRSNYTNIAYNRILQIYIQCKNQERLQTLPVCI